MILLLRWRWCPIELNQIIKKITNDKISEIHTALPAKIEEYDPEEMRAEIVLLNKKELEEELVEIPPILDVPVSFLRAGPFVIRPPYQKGDPVIVVFGERAIDRITITGEPEEVVHTRRHSYDDAIVIGGLQVEQADNQNSEWTDDLLIEHTEEDSRIVLEKGSGNIIIETEPDKVLLGSRNASHNLTLGDLHKEWADNHTHTGVEPGGGVSGTPSSNCPEPSEIVFTEE